MAYAVPSRRRGNSILPSPVSSVVPADTVPSQSSLSSRGTPQQHYQLKHDYSDFSSTGFSNNTNNNTFSNTHTNASSPSSQPQSQLAPPRASRMRSGSGAVSPGLSSVFAYAGVVNAATPNSVASPFFTPSNASNASNSLTSGPRRTHDALDKPASRVVSTQETRRSAGGVFTSTSTTTPIPTSTPTTSTTTTTRIRASTSSSGGLEPIGSYSSERLTTSLRERERSSPAPPRTHSHSVSVPSVHSLAPSSYHNHNIGNSSYLSARTVSSSPSPTSSTFPHHLKPPTPSSASVPSVALTSTVDIVGKRLREEQLQTRVKAAQAFVEKTLGVALPSSDLHESLKDGVILCKLANRLRPGTVQQISLKNLPFVKMENIGNFLIAAKKLGVQSSDLFQTVDLYEGKDMTQVVSTILTLERVIAGTAWTANKRPGPTPIVSEPSAQIPVPAATAPIVNRVRSKTAHTPRTASATASIRPSSSAYYAAQVRKLEEESMRESLRFTNGYDHQESLVKVKDRHMSTPAASRALSPPTSDRVSHRPSLNDIEAELNDLKIGPVDITRRHLDEGNRREQRDLVFGSTSPPSFDHPPSLPKSASGPLLTDGRQSALDMSRRKKKSISLDPQAANSVMGISYRDIPSPGSPGLLIQSASYNALSNMNQGVHASSLKNHTRFSSDRTLEGSFAGTPINSRSTTPVQGLKKSAEPLREKLELYENESLAATALNLGTGQMVAVKRIKIDGLKDTEMDILMQEVDLLKSLTHPSIVKYEGFIKTYGHLNIILEFVENGSLLTTLKSFGTFPEKLVVAYVVKILEGLVYLHGKEVVHCDLKAANILTTKNGNVKLSDFGVSLNLKVKESDFGAVAGTPNWMAPEVIELKGASPASDIWSLGCTIIEMLTGRPPYAELLAMTTLFRIVEDERPPLPTNISVDLLDFLCQCFQKDPTLRPSAGALGRHVWIKRNFGARELKPMDSLPYMKRKSLEPKEHLLLAALEGGVSAAKRASTPLGLTSGVPPPTGLNVGQVHGRGVRRGSVDSASVFYSSATVPGPTAVERLSEARDETSRHHKFVKSSFAKHCSMVFHRKCQFFVGETCFPSPHLSYFQTPTPAQSVPNLKLLAGGHDKGSRPNSRSSQAPHDRSRSATPSQMASRPTPTPPPSNQRRGSTEYRVMSPPPASSYTPRMTSPEQIVDSPSQKNSQRPPSRQEDSPNSPTLDGLRNLLSAQKRFSLGTKKSQSSIGASKLNPLPTPPASYTSTTPSMPGSRASSNTPDRSALRDSTQPMPVPILKGGSGGRAYRGKQYLPGPLDTCDEDITVRRTGQRRSSINLFSTSAPPVPVDYGQSNNYSPFQNLKHPNEDEDEFTEDHAAEMVEEDLEALLIPSIVRSPRRSIDAGHPLIEHRGKSQSIGQILDRDEYSFASSLDPTHGFGQDSQGRSTSAARPSHARSNGYHSSGSSSAAMASSSFSSHTKNNSSASSLGSVAAMLEEEDRFMKENYAGYPKNGAPSAYQASSQPPQAHHVGIKTMLSRFSNPTGVPSNDSFLGSSEQAKSSTRHQIP
ncbi:hypothetical protein CPC16_001096, partial [Podila verticillata]